MQNVDLARLDCLAYHTLMAKDRHRRPIHVIKRAAINLANWWGTPSFDKHAPRHLDQR